MKYFLFFFTLLTFSVSAQTPFPLLNPTNPDSVIVIGNSNGAPRRIYNTDLLKNKVDKTATISINGTTKTLSSNPSFSISGSGGSSTFNLADTSNGAIVYNVLKYGAKGDGTTDDTQGIQAAINAAVKDTFSSYGVVYFPYTGKEYMIKGLMVTVAPNGKPVDNCQIYIPDLSPSNSRIRPGSVKLLGQVSPNFYIQTAVQITDTSNAPKLGVVLHSTDTTNTGAIIGTAYTNFPTFGNFNYTKVEIENLGFVVASTRPDGANIPAKMTGINAYSMAQFGANNVFVKTETNHHNTQTVAPASTAYGIKMPHGGNWGYSVLNNVWAQGFYSGFLVNEHFVSTGMLNATFNVNGIEFASMPYHGAKIQRLLAQLNTYHVKLPSSGAKFQFDFLEIESDKASGQWWQNVYDIYQPTTDAGTNYGTIRYDRFRYDQGFTDNANFSRSPNVSTLVYTDPITKRFLNIGGDALGSTYKIGSLDAFDTYLQANNLPRLVVTSAGKVNMGTSPVGMTETGDVNIAGAAYASQYFTSPGVRVGQAGALGSYALQVKPTTAISPLLMQLSNGITVVSASTNGNLLVGTTTDNSKLTVAGSVALPLSAKTQNYTATGNDYTLNCTGTITITLPTAVGITGRIYVVKNSGAGVITMAGTSSQTFDGATSPTIAAGGVNQYQSDGANWIKIN